MRETEIEKGEMSGEGKTVCVTGASGYVASWLVKLLLQRGYTVRASVRDPSDPKKTEHLRALDGASERLHLLKADLLEEGSFDSIINGCDGVFHVASPVQITFTDPQSEVIDPAIKRTLNVLKSFVDESWFSSPEFCEKSNLWYHLSKTLAEQAAWKFSKENGIDMVVIIPGYIIGPLLQPTLNASSNIFLNFINGSSTFPYTLLRGVNVKDVAMAHILAYENPSANGRYCVVESVVHYSDLIPIIHKLYLSIPLPQKCEDEKPFDPICQISNEKARNLGVKFIPLETSIKEAIESLKEMGFVKF
ncbi:hypothetical protein LUZ60_011197 [Juncus effusus]|nr:hypothetical protein LUZ60_011197 [Juncus effusus]